MTPENEKQVERILIIVIIGLALITLVGVIVWPFTSRLSPTSPIALTSGTSETENLTGVPYEQANEPSLESTNPALAPRSPAAGEVRSPSATPVPTYARPQPRFGSSSSTPTPTPTPEAAATPAPNPTPELLAATSQTSIAAGSSASTRAECPAGSTIVGGGFSATYDTEIWRSYRSGQGWYVDAHNSALTPANLSAYAQCVSGIPGSTSVYADSTTVAADTIGEVTKSCPEGKTAVSGGFYAANLNVIFSNRVGNGWQVKAENPTRASHTLSVFVNCYSGGPISLTQVQKNKNIAAGVRDGSDVACTEGLLVMGGYSFSSAIDNSYYTTPNATWKFSTRNHTTSTTQLKVYGQCATF